MSLYNKLALFVGGTLFGSVGIKLLSSKDAKKAYVHATAAGLRMKDYVNLCRGTGTAGSFLQHCF